MLQRGARIGEYEVLAPLRTGGMAALYLGRRAGAAGFTKPVAIKVIHPHLAKDPSFIRMFLDEARLSARIQDPNVVHVEDLGEADGMFYLAMEYVLGVPLSALLARLVQGGIPLEIPIACAIAMRVADGLHAAHELRDEHGHALEVVHRDVSPQNVLLSESGHVKLIDFGVARARGRLQETEAGELKGKVRYMSPEQAFGRPIDRRTDVYALGIVLWEMLVQRRYIEGDNDMEALDLARAPVLRAPSSLRPEISAPLDAVLVSALAPALDARFETALALRRAIANAVPDALRVEPSDLATLVESQFAKQLESERALLTSPGRSSLPAPSIESVGGQPRSAAPHSEAETRAARGSDSREGQTPVTRPGPQLEPAVDEPARSAGLGDVPSLPPLGSAAPATGAPAERGSVWLRVALALVLLVTVATLSFVAGWILPSPAPSVPTPTPPRAERSPLAPPASIDPCADVHRARLHLDETSHVTFDTTGARSLFALRGLRSPEGEPAPDAVLEIEVLGDARATVDLSTATPETDEHFDTIFAVFDGACRRELVDRRPDHTADDHGGDLRARGSFAVRGGSVVTVVLSGFGRGVGNRDRGRLGVALTAHPAAAPTISGVSGLLAGDAIFFELRGTDLDLDADRARVRLFDASGGALSVVARGEHAELPQQTILLPLQTTGEVSGVGRLLVRSSNAEQLARAVRAEVVLVDRAGNVTEARTVELARGELVGPHDPCDATHRCAEELACDESGHCAPLPERAVTCGAATTVVLDPARETRLTRTLPAGYALFETSCCESHARGREDVVQLEVPSHGRYDVVVGTRAAEERSGLLDMVLSARTSCLDSRPSAMPPGGCNDDRSEDERDPRLELRVVTPGSRFYVLASAIRPDARFETGGLAYVLTARLRAVRGPGEACDAEHDRCETGTCSARGVCE
ncbi:MAG: protein kinase [Sandaracinus sp.]